MTPASREKLRKKARRVVGSPPRRFLAVIQPALRALLREELLELGFESLSDCEGGIEFEGGLAEAWRANLNSRLASRIWVRAAAFKATALEELFRKTNKLPWELYLSSPPEVEAVVERSRVRHEGRTAETVDKAVRRRLAEYGFPVQAGKADRQRLLVRVVEDRVEISLDSSGALLHQRGWRLQPGEAPMRETEAAALLRFAGWRGGRPLVDGMCGSGTFAIEAALSALGRPACCGADLAPLRRFAFEGQPAFQEGAWRELLRRASAAAAVRAGDFPPIIAVDLDEGVLRAAAGNAGRAGLEDRIRFLRDDFFACDPAGMLQSGRTGLLVLNPPYGLRLEGSAGLYADIGRRLFSVYRGWDALVLAADGRSARALGRPPERSLVFRHGGLKVSALFFAGADAGLKA